MSIRPRRRFRAVLMATAVGAALVLSGCSGGSESPEPAGSADAGAPAPAISIAATSGPNSLDPAQIVDGAQVLVWGSIYDTLLARDPKTAELIPNAAESWEYNADGTELTLKLHEGMTFSNGDPVDAEAVAGTMMRTKSTPGIVQPKFALVEDVTAEDELTVKIRFSAFDPQFVWNLALGAGAIANPATFDDPELATNPVGSGPYTLDTASTVAGTSYTLKKRDDYWNDEAFPYPTATIRVLQDPTAVFNAVQAGEVNAASLQSQLMGQLDASKFTITNLEAQAIGFLNIMDRGGEKFPALGDQRVRQAINYAIDREGILKGIYAGDGLATEQIFNPAGQVYDEALNETYEYDPEKGKELVEEAGFAGETLRIPSTFLTTQVEATLSQAFKDIGMNLEWVAVPPQQAQSALQSGEYGITYQITGYNSDPADAFYHFDPNGYGNPFHYTNDELEGFLDEINNTVNYEDALPTYKALNEYAVEQAYEAPIVFVGGNWVTADDIEYIAYGGAPLTLRNFQYNG
jgi:peptide/nickel transport system substrate-binding protein